MNQPRMTAQEAMDYIEVQRAIGLTPVMRGTSYYRHNFMIGQFGYYIEYLDERGTAGMCLPKNLLSTFDFISLGQPVAGTAPDLAVPAMAPERGYGIASGIMPGERAPSLLEAAELALVVMDAAGITGRERDGLAQAIKAERRIH